MQPKDAVKSVDYWDQYRCPKGLEGREVAAKMNKGHFDLTTWGLKHVRVKPDFVVLDIGFGGGKTLSRLARRAFLGKVYGIDYSADMVDYSRQANRKLMMQERLEISQGSVEKLGFKDEFFDLVTAIETYYFWPNLSEAFHEIKRVLKDEGKLLIISEMIKDGAYEVKHAQTISKTQVHLLTLAEIQNILYYAGFSKVTIYRKRKSVWNAVLAQK
jgi:ubiquinone/menaquinone biosynthesis C-methylase UbiE